MTNVETNQLCRLTVAGPDRQTDLAVPVETPIAELLPVLLRHTTDAENPKKEHQDRSWVLQRLGGAPLDPAGTPESLDLLEGERLYLCPAESPLPALHFDDLADGIAESVDERWDRWRPEHRRPLFLTLSAVVLCLLVALLITPGPTWAQAGTAIGFGLLSVVLALVIAHTLADRALTLIFGLAGCVFAAVAAVVLADGVPDGFGFSPASTLIASAVVAAVGTGIAITGRLKVPAVPVAPFLGVAVAALCVVIGLWLLAGLDLSVERVAGIYATALFAVLAFAPKLAIRAARLRGPQLPKKTEELQFDIEAEPAAEVRVRTTAADEYLSVAAVAVMPSLVVSLVLVSTSPGWAGWTFVAVMAAGILLRAAVFHGWWQRAAMIVTGGTGAVLVFAVHWVEATPGWRGAMLAGLVLVLGAVVAASLRPPPRRLLPIWQHVANISESVTALALVPVLLQILGVYGWARGMFG